MIRRKVLIAGIFLLLILVFIAKCPPVFPRTVPHLYKALPNAIPLVLGWGDLKETLELNSGTFFLPERTRQLLGKILDLSPSGKPVALVLGVQNTGKGEFVNTLILDWRKSSLSIASMAAQLDWQQQSESVFKNQAIYGFTTEDYGNFTIAHYQGLLLLGKYAFQVEEAIIQLIGDGQSIAEDKGFRKLSPDRKSNGQPLVSINVELFHTLGKDVWSDYVLSQIRKLAESYSWLGFRLKMKDNQVEIEGQYTPTSANSCVKAIAGKTGNDLNALSNILPANTAFFKQVHIGNTSEYFSTLTQNHPKWFEDHFLNWVTGDVALAQMENRHFLVLGCSNRPAMETGLDAFLASSGQLESAPYQSFEIRRVVEEDLLRPFWNEEGLSLKNPYAVILDPVF